MRSRVRNTLSVVVRTQGELQSGRSLLEESVALLRTLEDPWALGLALTMLAEIMLAEGDEAAAGPLADESLTLFRMVHDPWGMATLLVTRGQIALRRSYLIVKMGGLRTEASRTILERQDSRLSL